MGLVILSHRPSSPVISISPCPSSSASGTARIRSNRWLNPRTASRRFENFASRCYFSNSNAHSTHVATEDEVSEEFSSGCSVPIVHLKPDILETTETLNLVANIDNLLTTLPVLSEEEQSALAATPAHPAGLYEY